MVDSLWGYRIQHVTLYIAFSYFYIYKFTLTSTLTFPLQCITLVPRVVATAHGSAMEVCEQYVGSLQVACIQCNRPFRQHTPYRGSIPL